MHALMSAGSTVAASSRSMLPADRSSGAAGGQYQLPHQGQRDSAALGSSQVGLNCETAILEVLGSSACIS